MSGLAEVFLNHGYSVSGSDQSDSESTRRLADLGVRIHIGHRAQNIAGANVVIVTSAIRQDNPELVAAREARVPVIPRAEMLGELMRGKVGLAVAGTHGKTTTTSILATIFTQAGLDPTLVIGGKVDQLGGNAKLGRGDFVVAEADESDGSFHFLPAQFAIVTNIDDDHLDHYGTLDRLDDAFVKFIGQLPFYGRAVVCGDDPGVQRCLLRLTKPYVTYGFGEDHDYRIAGATLSGMGHKFRIESKRLPGGVLDLDLAVAGRHNVLNATAAAALAFEAQVDVEAIKKGVAAYSGVRRRMELRWRSSSGDCLVIDDYGHHPTEIAATLSALRSYWKGRILTVFQPHRYSRTQQCREGFAGCFGDTDVLIVTDVYAASEDPIDGITGEALTGWVKAGGKAPKQIESIAGLESAAARIDQIARPGDLVLSLGAGSITRLATLLKLTQAAR